MDDEERRQFESRRKAALLTLRETQKKWRKRHLERLERIVILPQDSAWDTARETSKELSLSRASEGSVVSNGPNEVWSTQRNSAVGSRPQRPTPIQTTTLSMAGTLQLPGRLAEEDFSDCSSPRSDCSSQRLFASSPVGSQYGDSAAVPASTSAPRQGTQLLKPDLGPVVNRSSLVMNGFEARHPSVVSLFSEVDDRPDFMQQAAEKLQVWRGEFSLKILDQIADAYESFLRVPGQPGYFADLETIEEALRNIIKLPNWAIKHEIEVRNLFPDDLDDLDVISEGEVFLQAHFTSLAQFLEVIHGAVLFTERQDAEALWSESELRKLNSKFRKYIGNAGTLPVGSLLQAIQELELKGLRLTSVQQQRWLADLTKATLGHHDDAAGTQKVSIRSSSLNAPRQLMLSFKDFCRIVFVATREIFQKQRLEDFRQEEQAREQGHFGLLEVEDLRELYKTFIQTGKPAADEAATEYFERLLALFRQTGVKDFGRDELALLRDIVSSSLTDEGSTSLSSPKSDIAVGVPFPRFVSWMHSVFKHRLCGLVYRAPTELTLKALEGRSGFSSVMIREHLMSIPSIEVDEVEVASPMSGDSAAFPTQFRRGSRGLAFAMAS